jgi:hypothetical protein
VADYLIDTMNGIDSAIESGLGKIRHQQRVSAAVELLKRALDHDPEYAHTSAAPTLAVGPVTPEGHPHDSEQEADESDNPEHPIHPVNPDSDEEAEPIDYVAMAKEIVANLDPSEFEEEPESNHKPDYSMWDIIRKQPPPVITEEHQRIAMARLDEKLERRRLWKESSVKIPTRKDNSNYDDG